MGSNAALSLQIPLPRSSSPLTDPPRLFRLRPFPSPPARCCCRRRHSSRITSIRASSSSTGDGSTQFTWENISGSLRLGSARFVTSFAERFRKETGLDIDGRSSERAIGNELRSIVCGWSWCLCFWSGTSGRIGRFKKGMWRKAMPKGFKIMKFIEGSSGQLIQDKSYVGEVAWDEDPAPPEDALAKIIDREKTLSLEDKKSLKEKLGIPGAIVSSVDEYDGVTWRERLRKWKDILQKQKFTEQMDSLSAKYVVILIRKKLKGVCVRKLQRGHQILLGAEHFGFLRGGGIIVQGCPTHIFLIN